MLVGLTLAGCSPSAQDTAEPVESDGAGVAPDRAAASPPAASTPSQTPTTPAPDDEDRAVAPSDAPDACGVDDRDAMRAAVLGQLDAIVARDWAAALDYTASSFREGVDAAEFERIIVEDFPVVAAGVAADPSLCLLAPDGSAALSVTVEDRDGTQQDLVYLFGREAGRWLIRGAVPQQGGDGDDPAITI